MKVSFKGKASLLFNIISQPEQLKKNILINCISLRRVLATLRRVLVHFTYRVHRFESDEILELKKKNIYFTNKKITWWAC